MTPTRLVADTYSYFREHGHWPLVRTLQADYGPRFNVRALAAEAGRDTIICQAGADGRCQLTLQALRSIPGAADDLERLARAVAFIGSQYAKGGSASVDHAAIGASLGIEGVELQRLGALLYLTSRLWSGGTFATDYSTFAVSPSEEALFFRDVKTFAEVEETTARIERDDRRIAGMLSTEYQRARGAPAAPPADESPARYRLADPDVDALIQRDLAELTTVQSVGAWKSAAVLAGSCLESLLFDVCKRHEPECIAKWSKRWPAQVNASDLAAFAASRKWITDDQGQLASVLRRWRNTVHPYTALAAKEPTKELADALIAVLRLMVADLSHGDAA